MLRSNVAILFFSSLLVTQAASADVILEQSFETCNTSDGYQLLDGVFTGDANDYLECGNSTGAGGGFTFAFAAGNATGQNGTMFIAQEDFGPGLNALGMTCPNGIVLDPIDITDYVNLSISLLFASPNATATRYESTDYLHVEYRIDGSGSDPFIVVGNFIGAGSYGDTIGMYEDDNLNGTIEGGDTHVTGLTLQRFTFSLNNRAGQGTVSGSTLDIRVTFSCGPQEEMAFDDIIVEGTPVPKPVMNLSATSYTIGEDGTPSGPQVTINRSNATSNATSIQLNLTSGTATAGADFDGTPITINFAANETSKTVDIPITDDDIDEDNETFSIALVTNGSGAQLGATTSAQVTITDNDTADVVVSKSTLSVAEGGATDSYTLVLASKPTDDVVVSVTVSDGQTVVESGTSPASSVDVTFTSGSWDTPQAVVVTAVDDLDVEANPHSGVISMSVASNDGKYDGFSLSDIDVSITDNDSCGDAYCNPTESTVTCPDDCGTSCGDGACNGGETTANCVADCGSACGDTVANGTEPCDGNDLKGQDCPMQGFDFGTLTCAVDCTAFDTSACADNRCGDGIPFGAEQCDDGDGTNSDTVPDACRSNCTSAGCGDGVVDTGELCDTSDLAGESCTTLGFASGSLACAGNCTSYDDSACVANRCGDGVVLDAEECDDGDASNSDTVPDACRTNCISASCGDGVIDTGETCDSSDLAGESCVTLGFASGTLACASDCKSLDSSACVASGTMSGTGGDVQGTGGVMPGTGGDMQGTGGSSDSGTGAAMSSGGSADSGGSSGSTGGSANSGGNSGSGGSKSGGSSGSGGSKSGGSSSAGGDMMMDIDAGVEPQGEISGGCGCRMTPSQAPRFSWLCSLPALLLWRRRRQLFGRK